MESLAKLHRPSGHTPPPRTKKCMHGRRFGNCEKCNAIAITDQKYRDNKSEQERYNWGNNSEPIITVWEGNAAKEQVFERNDVKGPPPKPPNATKVIGRCSICGYRIFKEHKVISGDVSMAHRDCCIPCSHHSTHLIRNKYRVCPACKGRICMNCSTYVCPIKEAERKAKASM